VKSLRLSSSTALVFGVFALSCDRGPTPPPAPSVSHAKPAEAAGSVAPPASVAKKADTRAARPEKLNVLLLTIDSLRADMPWTGYPREIAPNLTALAKESVVYTHAYSVSSYTAKSVAAMLTGRYPSSLYRSGWFFANYSKANEFFTESLQQKGIRTMGWHGHMYFGRGKGLEQGFDVWELVPGITFDPQTDNHTTSDKMTKLGIELLGKPENTGGQFFAWAHFMDPHDVYNKHPESPDFGNKGRDRYDSEVFYADLWLGKLLEFCKKQPWWKNTAVIISADHGEAFGEHSMYRHAFEVWEVLTRVPLIIKAPGAEPRKIDLRRSMIDLAPTVMDLMGQPALDGFMGKSLAKEVYGAAPESREPIVVELSEDSHNPYRRGIIKDDYKLIVLDAGWKYQLYNLKDDPDEKQDLAKKEPEKLEQMKKLFESTYASIPSVQAYGGMKLKSGKMANGPMGPAKAEPASSAR
jgi:choline-sulfatase